MLEFHNHNIIKKTRRTHMCVVCSIEIPTGFGCVYEAGKYDGDFFSNYSHHECSKKIAQLNEGNDIDEWYDLVDCMDGIGESTKEWRTMIEKKYGLR